MGKTLLLDNYDSFTYNLAHLLESLGCEFEVKRNDKISVQEVSNYDRILLSPGPGIPSEAGNMPEIVRKYAESKPILGICLGHQCIGEVFGAKLINMAVPVHGKSTAVKIEDDNEPIFKGLPKEINAGRYHSWLIDKKGLPAELRITAVDGKGDIMALTHARLNVKGVQFHPESVMTEIGGNIIKNWLSI